MYTEYGNSKFSHLFIQILFFVAGDSSADVLLIKFWKNEDIFQLVLKRAENVF